MNSVGIFTHSGNSQDELDNIKYVTLSENHAYKTFVCVGKNLSAYQIKKPTWTMFYVK